MDTDGERGPDELAERGSAEAQRNISAVKGSIEDRMGHRVKSVTHISFSHVDGKVPLLGLFEKNLNKVKNLSALAARLEAVEVANRRVRVSTEHIHKAGPIPLSKGRDEREQAPLQERVCRAKLRDAVNRDRQPVGDWVTGSRQAVQSPLKGVTDELQTGSIKKPQHFHRDAVISRRLV